VPRSKRTRADDLDSDLGRPRPIARVIDKDAKGSLWNLLLPVVDAE